MKKIMIVCLVVLVLIVSAAGVYLYLNPSRVSLDSLVPEESLVYLRMNKPKENFEKILQSQFWQSLTAIDYDKAFKALNVESVKVASIQAVYEGLQDPKAKELYQKFFSKETAFLVMAPLIQDSSSPEQMLSQSLSGIVVMTKVGADVRFDEFAIKVLGINQKFVQKKYLGITINSFSVSELGGSLQFARVGDVVVFGASELGIQRVIDVYRKKTKTLITDPEFIALKAKLGQQEDSFGYVDVDEIAGLIDDQFSKITETAGQALTKSKIQEVVFADSGLKTIAFASKYAELINTKIILSFDESSMSDEFKENLALCKPMDNKSLLFVPQQSMYYQWNACFSLEHAWEQVTQRASQVDSNVTSSIKSMENLESTLGVSFEDDVIPSFGKEIGGLLLDVDLSGQFPLPQIIFFVSIKDQSMLDKLIETISQKTNSAPQIESYQNKDIKYWTLPVAEGLEPSLVFLDNYLLVGINRPVLKEAMDVYFKSKDSLLTNESFKSVNLGLSENNVGLQVVDIHQIFELIDKFVDWGSSYLEAQDEKKLAFISGTELKLKDTESKIIEIQQEIKNTEDQIVNLQNSIASISAQAPEYVQKQSEVSQAQEKLRLAVSNLDAAMQQSQDLAKVVAGFSKQTDSQLQKKAALNDFVHPMIDAFKSWEYFGQKVLVDKNFMELDTYLKVK